MISHERRSKWIIFTRGDVEIMHSLSGLSYAQAPCNKDPACMRLVVDNPSCATLTSWQALHASTVPKCPSYCTPCCQREPVASKRAFIWAHIIPNRVGKPKMSPSAAGRSFAVIMGMSFGFSGACILDRIVASSVSAT
jgi:hypothetical protein